MLFRSPTFATFSQQWMAENEAFWKTSHSLNINSIFERYLLPAFGSQPIDTITRADILNFRGRLGKGYTASKRSITNDRINHIMTPLRMLMAEASERYEFLTPFRNIKPLNDPSLTVFFADDSVVARRQITRTLEAMNVKYVEAINGRHAWIELEKIANYALASGVEVNSLVNLVLTDVEMPEMDGYILTKKIKSDPRFNGIAVVMHSSLSGMSNQKLGMSVGVDEYVPKFEPQRLSETLARRLGVDTAAVSVA